MFITILLLIGLIIPCYASKLPNTGQTQSYTTTFGEDHDYQPAATQMSYTDNGDGTITDNITSLMWQQDGNYPFNGFTTGGTWEQALGYCENLVYAGYSDWRLPNRRELFSIVDFGTTNDPSINKTYFSNTQYIYWTSTTCALDATYAFLIFFQNPSGVVQALPKTWEIDIRCVRAGP